MDHQLAHAQGVGHQAGVLAARPAEAGQDILRHVVAALDRDLPHGLGHVFHGDGHEALGDLDGRHHLAGRRQDLGRQGLELRRDHVPVQRLVGVRAEHRRKEVRRQLAQHDVRIGHGQGPAPAVAHRGRDWRRPNPDQPGSASRRTCRIEPPPAATVWMFIIGARMRTPGHHGLVGAFILAREMTATSVEVPPMSKPITRSKPASDGRLRHGDHPAGRAGEDRVLAPEEPRACGQAAVRHA
jgi:hypothetical protein